VIREPYNIHRLKYSYIPNTEANSPPRISFIHLNDYKLVCSSFVLHGKSYKELHKLFKALETAEQRYSDARNLNREYR